MVIAVLILATLVDLALAALLINVSGFIFGSGPESTHGGALMLAAYVAFVIACIVLPIIGFVLNRRQKAGLGMLLAWLPPVGALLVLAIPAPY